MSYLAGEVYAVLGAKVDTAKFVEYDQRVAKAASSAENFEQRHSQAMKRSSAASKAFGESSAQAAFLAGKRADEYDAKVQRASESTSRSFHTMGQAAKIGAGAGILALGAILVGSVKKAADFEAQLSSLQSVSGATGKQMGALKKSAMDAGAATKFSALEAAQAQTELAKGGLSVSKILGGGLKGALALAAAGEMNLADAASTTANALNLFHLNGNQATHVADALATAANSTTADVSDFAIALTQGGAAAKAAGLTFNQTIAYLEAMANAGVKGSDAGTSMKTALTQIASPSKQAAAEMKKLNLEFFDAQGKIKPLPAIAKNLDQAFGGLTQKQRLQAAATIAGTDGMRGLLALFDSSPAQLSAWEHGLERQGTAAEVAAKKQDNLKGKIENLKGSLETAGIALGQHLIPILTRGAENLTDTINKLSAEGKIDDFANGLISGGEKAATVLADVGSAAGQVAADVAPAVGALGGLAGALDLGDPGHIEAILAAVLGFKAAGVVAPMVATLATNIRLLSTAPTAGALAGDLLAMVNPVTAVSLGIAGLAAGLILLGGHEDAEAAAAKANAAAHKAQADAIKSVMDAEQNAADKGIASQRAKENLKQAEDDLDAARSKYGKNSDEYRRALTNERQAYLDNKGAAQAYTKVLADQDNQNRKNINTAREHISATEGQVKSAGDTAFVQSRTGNANDQAAANKRLAEAQGEHTRAVQAYVQAIARANVSDLSRQRLMSASTQIGEKNVQGISKLISAMGNLPTKTQTQILLTGKQAALADLGSLAGQLTALGRKRTVTQVLANANSASAAVLAFRAILSGVPSSKVAKVLATTSGKAEVAALKALIDNTNSKSVALDVTTRYKQIGTPAPIKGSGGSSGARPGHATGRGPGGAERALVGENPRNPREAIVDPARGTAWMVDQPTVVGLPDTAYVIPEDPAMRGRAMGLLAQLAGDLGLRGFKAGKAPAKKKTGAKAPAKAKAHRDLPADIKPINIPVDSAKTKRDAAKTPLDKAKKLVDRLPKNITTTEAQVRDIERRKPKTAAQKANKADDLKRAKKKLADQKKELRDAQAEETKQRKIFRAYDAEWQQGKKYQALIDKQTSLANTAASDMRTADSKDDQGAYDDAKKRRTDALSKLGDLLTKAKAALKDQDSAAADTLTESIATNAADLQDATTSESGAETQADRDAGQAAQDEADKTTSTGMTAAERARLSEINKNIALAALTEPLDDDKATANDLVGFLQGVLNEDLGNGTSSDVITDIAGQLKQAKDNVKSLTDGGKNSDSDLQAQLDQVTTAKHVSDESARINAQGLATFAGYGDIGSGGPNALTAARGGPSINVYTLHPGDPATLRAIGDAATKGQGLQPSRTSYSERIGF